ncbi:cyclic AMP-dependent transcription factor ATF-1 isoform X3 [Parasteatoda tepidariorum]|uniref:cyclic AMP-dependent transcription factor ATF-1 isoform X3 n=1 Tax=Parasteatoda tepidariorum TaxID=114398 RepID=UPI001C728600|nr:cyclic AMP-dependent transcription factor ATF-1 isoform X3 [Parasteatoda tepidariorum]XP_042900908.1 cyclic AMP-dependent transcription factor ATF-1 isoform X4 [Parasteatoda tepidariorum]XP_042900909.1 cyclic AMP-dependent transcription factor ATF-1 isoform X3 [Parasteatoda tepidariorum]
MNSWHAMETLVADQSATVETSQADQSSNVGSGTVGQNDSGNRTSGTTAQVRANGTVVLAAPAQVKHQNTQAIAVPQAGGGVSIVHVALQNQPVHVQSVIQPGPNQQSVIQAPGGTTLQSVQLPKNVILLNKLTGTGSVIHSTDGDASVHPVQLITTAKDEDGGTVTLVSSEDPKKRREILARRPSYRKILNELSATEAHGATLTGAPTAVLKEESSDHTMTDSSQEQDSGASTITVGGTQYSTTGLLKAIQLATATQDSGIQGLQTLTMTNTGSGSAIVQYTQGQDGQFFVPVTVSAADLQAYQIRTGASPTSGLTQNVVSNIQTIQNPQQLAEEASRKRELRLLKNREAAKECRRKKKEYIKCLENRVAVLENQNKALIEELKSLKELYCQKTD